MGNLQSLFDIANSQVGYSEKDNANNLDSMTIRGSKNYTKYARDINAIGLMGCQGQAWCGVYQMWLEYKNNGKEEALKHLSKNFYNCFATRDWAKANGKWLDRSGTPKAGYRVIFSQSHIALVTKVTATKIYTNEGNTSDGTTIERDGGRVCNKYYDRNNPKIQGYVIVDYEDEKVADVISEYYIETGKDGLRVTTDVLNIRKEPNINSNIEGKYKNDEKVYPTDKIFVNGKPWFKVDRGYISASYLEGWIREVSDSEKRWWYVREGYNYIKSDWMGNYYFDKEGWMVTETYVKSKDKDIYYWIDKDGLWDGKNVPDLEKYKLSL